MLNTAFKNKYLKFINQFQLAFSTFTFLLYIINNILRNFTIRMLKHLKIN